MESQFLGHFSRRPERLEKRVTLPSGLQATIMETTGKEESVFSGVANKKDSVSSLNKFLSLVTKDLGEEKGLSTPDQIENLLIGDRWFILFQTRILSHGSKLELGSSCSGCGQDSIHEVDLQPILDSVKPYPCGNLREHQIVVDGFPLYFELANGKTERKFIESKELNVNKKIFGMRFWEETREGQKLPVDLSGLRSKDLALIRKSVKDLEFSLDANVTVICPNCNASSIASLTENVNFLFPNLT